MENEENHNKRKREHCKKKGNSQKDKPRIKT